MALAYPAWFSAVDRAVIDAALLDMCPPMLFFAGGSAREIPRGMPHVAGQPWSDLTPPPPPDSGPFVTDPVAVERVLTVLQAVGSRLPVPFPEARRQELDHLVAQIVVSVAATRASSASPLPHFETTVKDALSTCTWWPPAVKLTTKQRIQSRSLRDPARLKAERERVVLPLLDKLDWTPTKWATTAGVDPSVTLDYLAGTSTPRKVHRSRITLTLRSALKLTDLRLPD